MKKVRSKLCPTEIGAIKIFRLSPDGEVSEIAVECTGCTYYYDNLRELCEEWEDYEEPKEWWYIDIHGPHKVTNNDEYYQQVRAASKEIGNYFETKEEAKRAVKKLKAWKRLKDKGFRFDGYDVAHKSNGDLAGQIFYDAGNYSIEDVEKEMDLLFSGGKE